MGFLSFGTLLGKVLLLFLDLLLLVLLVLLLPFSYSLRLFNLFLDALVGHDRKKQKDRQGDISEVAVLQKEVVPLEYDEPLVKVEIVQELER